MVFLHIPHSLTEEEQMLQAKYAKLRKKKKQVAAFKNQGSTKSEQDQSSKTSSSLVSSKKSVGSLDAKEQAKKLIRSGNLKLQPSQDKEKSEKSTGFKRSQGLERKLTGLDNARAGYQPFSATHGPGKWFLSTQCRKTRARFSSTSMYYYIIKKNSNLKKLIYVFSLMVKDHMQNQHISSRF